MLHRLLEDQYSPLLACYRKARPKVGDGVWVATLTSTANRSLQVSQVRSTLGDAKMLRCIGDSIGKIITHTPTRARVTLAFIRLPTAPPKVGMGALTKREVQGVIRANLSAVRHCYEKAMLRRSKFACKIMVKFTIEPTGQVASAHVITSTMRDASFEACVEHEVLRWTFPKPRGSGRVVVKYPFIFHGSF
ncbi:MAG: AgmX/PglI C-terminal domain-containing protein [Deltaproteobacteria bacterium]|nr:AgmX/PglI C-terminal domain-containing protein [Deltaproteobacteria bacterium]